MKKTFLNLGKQPIANRFLYKKQIKNEYFFHLKMTFDKKTSLVTQKNYVDADLMFTDDYAYRGSMSKTMVKHFKTFSKTISPDKNILEIGSNDGVFLKNFSPKKAIAVEPCGNFAKETQDMGYTTYPSFWDLPLAKKIVKEKGKQDIVFAANCICHIPNLDSVFTAVKYILSKDGTFIFEDPSLAEMINNNSYDQIYDEHPHIFSVIALDNILKRNGLQVVKVEFYHLF